MITPIGLALQVTKLVEHPDRRSTFDHPYECRNRNLRWNQHQQMDVVNLDVQFDNLRSLLLAKGTDAFFDFLPDPTA